MIRPIRTLVATWLLAVAGLGLPACVSPALATVNEVAARNDYTGNGSVTAFAYGFRILTKTDIEVLVAGVVKTVDTDYTVSGLGASGGGTVTFTVAPITGATVALLRKQPLTQASVYVANEAFPAARLEKDLDKLQMQLQQDRETLGRALTFSKKSLVKDKAVPDPSNTVQLLAFDAAGNLVLLAASSISITGVVNPMSAVGDLIQGGAAGAPARLAKGADDTVLSVIAGALGYRLIPAASLATDAVETAKIKDGNVTAPKLRRFEGSAENAGVVTVTASDTPITTVDLGTVVTGDRILVYGICNGMTKGGTAGQSELGIDKSAGTATIAIGNDNTEARITDQSIAISANYRAHVFTVVKVTAGGTLTLRLLGNSAGSNSSVSAGFGQLYAWVIPGA